MTKTKHYPIILESESMRGFVEFLLNKFDLTMSKNHHLFLCRREICEIDKEVNIFHHGTLCSENFICLFFIDKQNGLTPIITIEEMKKYIEKQDLPAYSVKLSVKLKEAIKEKKINPDFVITFGAIEMHNGISNTCWAIHEFLRWKDDNHDEHEGFFNSDATVSEVLKLFSMLLLDIRNIQVQKPIILKSNESSESDKGIDIENAFKMDDVILLVLKKIPLEKQKQLMVCFCKKNKPFQKYLTQIPSWNQKQIKDFILQQDILNFFDEYREEIAKIMVEAMVMVEFFYED